MICFLVLRSRASLSISSLSGRRGRYAHAYGICAHFYWISLKKKHDRGISVRGVEKFIPFYQKNNYLFYQKYPLLEKITPISEIKKSTPLIKKNIIFSNKYIFLPEKITPSSFKCYHYLFWKIYLLPRENYPFPGAVSGGGTPVHPSGYWHQVIKLYNTFWLSFRGCFKGGASTPCAIFFFFV